MVGDQHERALVCADRPQAARRRWCPSLAGSRLRSHWRRPEYSSSNDASAAAAPRRRPPQRGQRPEREVDRLRVGERALVAERLEQDVLRAQVAQPPRDPLGRAPLAGRGRAALDRGERLDVGPQLRCQSTGPAVSTWLPSGRPEHALRLARARDQPLEVDAGVVAHLVQHRDEVLAGDVPGGARRHRAAAELAERRLERAHARAQRGYHVREALAAGVVEVGGQLDAEVEARRRSAPT